MELVHVHLPRTAGSSLEAHLRVTLSGSQIALRTGHFFWEDIPARSDQVVFTVIRDPVDRGKSLLKYILHNPIHRKHRLLSELGPLEWLNRYGEISQFSNGQVRHFVGSKALGRAVTLDDLELVKANLKNRHIVSCTLPDLKFGLAKLSKQLGYKIGPLEHRSNTSNPMELGPDVEQKLIELNQFDEDLFKHVSRKSLLTRALAFRSSF